MQKIFIQIESKLQYYKKLILMGEETLTDMFIKYVRIAISETGGKGPVV